MRKKGEATHYSLKECPFHGGAHRDQKKAHKTDIIVGKNGVGFKCWSEDCDCFNFEDLLDLLEERTGTRFELIDDEKLAERWGGIQHVSARGATFDTPVHHTDFEMTGAAHDQFSQKEI